MNLLFIVVSAFLIGNNNGLHCYKGHWNVLGEHSSRVVDCAYHKSNVQANRCLMLRATYGSEEAFIFDCASSSNCTRDNFIGRQYFKTEICPLNRQHECRLTFECCDSDNCNDMPTRWRNMWKWVGVVTMIFSLMAGCVYCAASAARHRHRRAYTYHPL